MYENLTFIRKISICKAVSLSVPGRKKMTKSLEILINEEGIITTTPLLLVDYVFPSNLPTLTSPPPNIFLSLAEDTI